MPPWHLISSDFNLPDDLTVFLQWELMHHDPYILSPWHSSFICFFFFKWWTEKYVNNKDYHPFFFCVFFNLKALPGAQEIVRYICIYVFFFFLPCWAACGILIPQPGIKPRPLAVRAQSPNYWTTREFPGVGFYFLVTAEHLVRAECWKSEALWRSRQGKPSPQPWTLCRNGNVLCVVQSE